MKSRAWLIIAFAGCVIGLFSTFIILLALVVGQGAIEIAVLRYLYNAIFFACPVIIFVNLLSPVFQKPLLATALPSRLAWIMVVADIAVFQLAVFLSMYHLSNFPALYAKYFVLLQLINLTYLWAVVCGLRGQENFHPFFQEVTRRPPNAVGHLIGYGIARISGKRRSK